MGASANKHLIQGQLNISNFFIQTTQHAMILSIHTLFEFHTVKSTPTTILLEASDELGLFTNLSNKADEPAIQQHKESLDMETERQEEANNPGPNVEEDDDLHILQFETINITSGITNERACLERKAHIAVAQEHCLNDVQMPNPQLQTL